MGGRGMENNFLAFITSPQPCLAFLRLCSLVLHVHREPTIPSHLLLSTKGQDKTQMWLKLIEPLQFQVRETLLKLAGLKCNFLCSHFSCVMLQQFYRGFLLFWFGEGVLFLLRGFFICLFLVGWFGFLYKLINFFFSLGSKGKMSVRSPPVYLNKPNLTQIGGK